MPLFMEVRRKKSELYTFLKDTWGMNNVEWIKVYFMNLLNISFEFEMVEWDFIIMEYARAAF